MRKLIFSLVILSLSSQAPAQQNKPQPSIRFGTVEAAKATREQIIAAPAMTDANSVVKIISFAVTFFPKGGDMVGPFSTKGSVLTPAEIALIKKYSYQPVKIIIDDIKSVELSDGVPRSLNQLVLNFEH